MKKFKEGTSRQDYDVQSFKKWTCRRKTIGKPY